MKTIEGMICLEGEALIDMTYPLLVLVLEMWGCFGSGLL